MDTQTQTQLVLKGGSYAHKQPTPTNDVGTSVANTRQNYPQLAERNNDTICTILKGIKEKRLSASPRTREFLMEQLIAAKVLRATTVNYSVVTTYDEGV